MKWISVKDKLPEYGSYFLATDGESYCFQTYGCMQFEHANCDYGCKVVDVTYWMPLPELPLNNQPERLSEKTSKEDAIV